MLRKRSMSLFAEPPHLNDEEDDAALSSSSSDDDDGDGSDAVTATGTWSPLESRTLLDAIDSQLPDADKISYSRRIKQLDWSHIRVPGRTEQDCKVQLMQLLKKIRHVRTLRELFTDVLEALQNPRTHKQTQRSAYALFCEDYRLARPASRKGSFAEWAEAYKQLPEAERQRYEALSGRTKKTPAERKKDALQRDVDKAPGTPFNLFCAAELAAGRFSKQQMRADFAKLPDAAKLVYVRQAVAAAQAAGRDSIELLTAREMKLLKGGSASAKPMTGYNLYVKEFFQRNANSSLTDVTQAYRELSAGEKKVYKERAAKKVAVEVEVEETDSKTPVLKRAADFADTSLMASPTTKKLKQLSLRFGADNNAGTEANRSANGNSSGVLQLSRSPAVTPAAESASARKRKAAANGGAAEVVAAAEAVTPLNAAGRSKQQIKMESSSEAESSSASKRAKRAVKAEKAAAAGAARKRIPEPERVPHSLFKFYVERVYEGKEKKAKKAFEKLEPAERKKLKREARKCMNTYIKSLEVYLKSLTKEEMVEYANRTRQQAQEQQTDEDFMESSSDSEQ